MLKIEDPNASLSEVMLEAIQEIEEIYYDPMYCFGSSEYRIEAHSWHFPGYDEHGYDQCEVCLAGAVMRKLGVGVSEHAEPKDFKGLIEKRMNALDGLRCGYVTTAAEIFGSTVPGFKLLDRHMPSMGETPEFIEAAYKLHEDLAKEGL